MAEEDTSTTNNESLISNLINEIIQSPLNMALTLIIGILIYKIVRGRSSGNEKNHTPPEPELPKLKKRDFTVQELKQFDGTQADGRVLVAVNSTVYDVTKGKRFYGPGK